MIKIREDISFEKPEERIREYCQKEIYFGYDDKHTIDNKITKTDIIIANNLYAMIDRYNPNESLNLLERAENIGRTLQVIKAKDIFGFTQEEWFSTENAIKKLLAGFLAVDGIGLAKATKILHLKRPNLFPVLDSYVMRFLLRCDTSLVPKNQQIELAVEALEITRERIINQESAFRKLIGDLTDLPIALTPVRMFDILCWTTQKWDILGKLTAPYGTPNKSLLQNLRWKS